MYDREDQVFKDALERVYQRILYGDNEKPGLHQGLRASQTWEIFWRSAWTTMSRAAITWAG
jgi:hypothetical protein